MTYRTSAISSGSRSRNSSNRSHNRGRQYSATKTAYKPARLGKISNFVVITVMFAMVGLLYLTQITKTSSYSYQLQNLEDSYSEKLKLNQALKIEAARLQSLDRLANTEKDLNFVSASNKTIEYSEKIQ